MPKNVEDEHTKFKLLMCGLCNSVIAWPDDIELEPGIHPRTYRKLCLVCRGINETESYYMVHVGKGQIRGA